MELFRRLAYLLRRRQFDRDLEDEMRFHLEMRAAHSGASAARRRFGSVALLQEESRDAWGWTALEAWLADLRHAMRALRRNPAFTAVAILTLALAIGAGTAVFSVVHAVLFRPLPFATPDRIMTLWTKWDRHPQDRSVVSWPLYRDWQSQAPSFESMAVHIGDAVRITVNGEPAFMEGRRVSGSFFRVLGVQPILGRAFLPEDERVSAGPSMILSYDLWQRLGGDRNLIGHTVRFDRDTFTVVGVMPRGFAFPANSEYYTPFAADDNRNTDNTYYLRVIGRLQPGASVAAAQSEAEAIAARRAKGLGAHVVPLRDDIVGDARRALLVLLAAIACVFLIACANLAGLLLARVTARSREFALRLSLGAGRWRLARCVLAESVLLAVAGGAIGIAAAHAIVRAFVAVDPIHLPRVHEIAVSPQVLLTAIAAALVTGLLFGSGPALRAGRSSLAPDLARAGHGLRGVLAAAQLAAAVVLLIGAGLLLRSFLLRVSVPLGFRPEGALGVELPWSTNRRIDDLLGRLAALPGVQAAGAATAFPHHPAGTSCDDCLEIEGSPKSAAHRDVGLMVATPDFFRAVGMTLLRGRYFTASDAPEAPKVAIVSEALARRDFPGRDPLVARVKWGGDWATIVGVVASAKGFGVAGDPMPVVYFPRGQHEWGNGVHVLVRTNVPPASLAAAVRREIRAWQPRLIIGKLDTVENLMAEAVAVPRFYLVLLGSFAALALAVSAVGIYGTVNYAVARRTREIGIRMALGAQRADVLGSVFRNGLRLAASGLAIGLIGAWISTRALQSLLFGVRPTDPAAFVLGSLVLVVAVVLACVFPARRATRVDPVEALRQD
jgi:predicted permease